MAAAPYPSRTLSQFPIITVFQTTEIKRPSSGWTKTSRWTSATPSPTWGSSSTDARGLSSSCSSAQLLTQVYCCVNSLNLINVNCKPSKEIDSFASQKHTNSLTQHYPGRDWHLQSLLRFTASGLEDTRTNLDTGVSSTKFYERLGTRRVWNLWKVNGSILNRTCDVLKSIPYR